MSSSLQRYYKHVTHFRPLLLLLNLRFPSRTIGLAGMGRGAHVHNRVLQRLLVVQPCGTFAVELTLYLRIGLDELSNPFLRLEKPLLEGIDLGLW